MEHKNELEAAQALLAESEHVIPEMLDRILDNQERTNIAATYHELLMAKPDKGPLDHLVIELVGIAIAAMAERKAARIIAKSWDDTPTYDDDSGS
jgi:hypothetical protein